MRHNAAASRARHRGALAKQAGGPSKEPRIAGHGHGATALPWAPARTTARGAQPRPAHHGAIVDRKQSGGGDQGGVQLAADQSRCPGSPTLAASLWVPWWVGLDRLVAAPCSLHRRGGPHGIALEGRPRGRGAAAPSWNKLESHVSQGSDRRVCRWPTRAPPSRAGCRAADAAGPGVSTSSEKQPSV